MALQATQIPAADQVKQLNQQLFDALLRQDQLERDRAQIDRELAEVRKNTLALTNILGGVKLGQQVTAETAPPAPADR